LESICAVSKKVGEVVAYLYLSGALKELVFIGQCPVVEILDDHSLVLQAKGLLIEQRMRLLLNIGTTDANMPLHQVSRSRH